MTKEIKSSFSFKTSHANINVIRFLQGQSSESGYFVSGGTDMVVRFWNYARQLVPLYEFRGGHSSGDILDACFSLGGTRIVSVGVDRAPVLWDVSSGKLFARLHGHGDRVNCCKFKDSSVLVTGSNDATVRLWDTRAKTCIQTLPPFSDSVTGVQCDDTAILGCSVDGSLRTFDVRTGKVYIDRTSIPIGCMSLSKDGKYVALSLLNSMIQLLDRNGSVVRTFQGHVNRSISLSSCLDHEQVHIGSGSEDGIVRFWDLSDGELALETSAFGNSAIQGPVLSVDHHPSRACFLVAGVSGLLKGFLC